MTKMVTIDSIVNSGGLCCKAEYRAQHEEKIDYLNKKTGKSDSFISKKLMVEMCGSSEQATIRLGRDDKMPDLFKKGDMLLVSVRGMSRSGGHLEIDADLASIRVVS